MQRNVTRKNDLYLTRELRKKCIVGIAALLATFFLISLIYFASNTPRNYYMKNLFVSGATILQCSTGDDDSSYGIQVRLDNPPENVSIDEDNTWISVDKQFYSAHSVGQQIGVLVCNYDVLKEKYFGLFGKQGQTFEKEMWSIDNAYDSLAAVQAAYPRRQFAGKSTLKSKTKLTDGEPFFVLDYDGREMTDSVGDNTYSRYNVGDSVPCNFDGYGDFIRIISIN